MYKERWKNYYFEQKKIHIPEKWVLIRRVGKDTLSEKAQEKLEWIILYHTIGNKKAAPTARYFSITRKTLHKYLKRFDEKNLTSLEEQSRSPHRTRGWMVTKEEEAHIKTLRKNNMEFGKKKLKVLYKKEYKETVTTWKIERVVRKYKLYPGKVKHDKRVVRQRKNKIKVRIHQVKEAIKTVEEFGFLWHVDAIIIWWYGQRRIIFTAIEDKTKIAYARVYKGNTSGYAEDFLKRLMYLVEGKIDIMHSDNGSEFQGEFERACEALHIIQIYSRPYTPKDNPALERFNGTIQTEWLDYSEVGLDSVLEANKDLAAWLVKYNSYRPHEALDYLTPLEYAQQRFFKVSPMYPARTKSQHISDSFYNYCLKGKYFVVIALYNSKRDFFVQKDFFKNNNEWELVGGWIREGENFDQALDRIVKKETGNKLVEAIPISIVNNFYLTEDKSEVKHIGVAFLGRVLHDSVSTQNGIFTSEIDKLLSKSDQDILKLGKRILKEKIIEPPLEEVEHDHQAQLLSKVNKYIVKPLSYNFSSKLLLNAIYKQVMAVNNKKDCMILDVACGDDKSVLKIASNAKLLIANDISREIMKPLIDSPLSKNIIFTNHNLLDLKYKIKFDVVICKNVMHHMRTPQEIGILMNTLKRCGKRIIIMDIENPKKNLIAKLWNAYYRRVTDDHGGLFISFNQFEEILKVAFPMTSKIETTRIKTIKGIYMLGIIDL